MCFIYVFCLTVLARIDDFVKTIGDLMIIFKDDRKVGGVGNITLIQIGLNEIIDHNKVKCNGDSSPFFLL